MKKIFRAIIAAMLMAVMAVSLCSCGIPSDPEKAKANLEKNGYAMDTTVSPCKAAITIKPGTPVDDILSFLDKVDTVIFAVDKETGKENVLIIYCKDADSAKTVNGDIKEIYKSIKDNAKENDSEADVKSGKSGNVVYIGTSAGVKAAG